MILGIGADIIDVRRIERLLDTQGERFIARIFTQAECDYAESATDAKRRILRYANRFAAKEAAVKALGDPEGISWQDIEVTRSGQGKPSLVLTAEALTLAQALANGSEFKADLSLSDEYPYSVAFVTLSC